MRIFKQKLSYGVHGIDLGYIDLQLRVLLVYIDGFGTSYAHSFLASTHARFYKKLDTEMSNKRRF